MEFLLYIDLEKSSFSLVLTKCLQFSMNVATLGLMSASFMISYFQGSSFQSTTFLLFEGNAIPCIVM